MLVRSVRVVIESLRVDKLFSLEYRDQVVKCRNIRGMHGKFSVYIFLLFIAHRSV
jgi:hypothetical protein